MSGILEAIRPWLNFIVIYSTLNEKAPYITPAFTRPVFAKIPAMTNLCLFAKPAQGVHRRRSVGGKESHSGPGWCGGRSV